MHLATLASMNRMELPPDGEPGNPSPQKPPMPGHEPIQDPPRPDSPPAVPPQEPPPGER